MNSMLYELRLVCLCISVLASRPVILQLDVFKVKIDQLFIAEFKNLYLSHDLGLLNGESGTTQFVMWANRTLATNQS